MTRFIQVEFCEDCPFGERFNRANQDGSTQTTIVCKISGFRHPESQRLGDPPKGFKIPHYCPLPEHVNVPPKPDTQHTPSLAPNTPQQPPAKVQTNTLPKTPSHTAQLGRVNPAGNGKRKADEKWVAIRHELGKVDVVETHPFDSLDQAILYTKQQAFKVSTEYPQPPITYTLALHDPRPHQDTTPTHQDTPA